ncbi:OmpA family protein [Breznakibacter xylanolyticus]|uniref:OmpA family protein n=1 Tax=Breznakibacter xylanolyticus TaxID=990 RepID=A0A2W7NCL5_9BACT|nr:OmpA family protein [Breznakibacter xylanolyticus]PZX17908.1 OmpA family protein [Breznakibacter xylanolyticus]
MKTLFVLMICMMPWCVWAQFDIKGKLKEKIMNRAEERVDQGIDSGLDAVEDEAKDAARDKSEPNDSEPADEPDAAEVSAEPRSASAEKIVSFTKYDFVPGDQLLFFEDFSQDAIGDFPALWTTNGGGEVRLLQSLSGNWLYMNSRDNVYCLMNDLTLPANFILEFDIVPTSGEDGGDYAGFNLSLYSSPDDFLNDDLYPGAGGLHVECATDHWNVMGYLDEPGKSTNARSELAPLVLNRSNHVIIWVQKRRLRIYHQGMKAVDLPTALYDNLKYNRLRFSLWSQAGFHFLSNIRLTSAAPDTRSKLLTEGKLVSYGIYFDVNSDRVKPESNGALADIAKVLNENLGVSVRIVGHTDSDGSESSNLDLSKRRALAVKNELCKNYGVTADRLQTDGKGESQPLVSGQTPSAKAQNRRVEFVKL